jgi:hypothetical protein
VVPINERMPFHNRLPLSSDLHGRPAARFVIGPQPTLAFSARLIVGDDALAERRLIA